MLRRPRLHRGSLFHRGRIPGDSSVCFVLHRINPLRHFTRKCRGRVRGSAADTDLSTGCSTLLAVTTTPTTSARNRLPGLCAGCSALTNRPCFADARTSTSSPRRASLPASTPAPTTPAPPKPLLETTPPSPVSWQHLTRLSSPPLLVPRLVLKLSFRYVAAFKLFALTFSDAHVR